MEENDPALVKEGDLLAGKYRVERVLGAGGMGVVVAARHVQLGQLVAIKFLKREALEQPSAIERFLRESRALASLRNEHVSRVLDVGVLDSGVPYMVMEFLEGRDLAAVLADSGPLDVELATGLVHQACKALAEAHTTGIVHRDLKPQNLFLTHTLQGSPRLKVLDFGISKSTATMAGVHGALTQTRAMLGSPLYMAPEQMRSSRNADHRSDVWALGVVLFELLTKRWPFEAEDLPELCLKVVTEPPLSLAALRPDTPRALVTIVERCLEKDPAQRFQSAMALGSALEPFVRRFEAFPIDSEPTIVEMPAFSLSQREPEPLATRVSHSDPSDLSMSASVLPSAPPGVSTLPAAVDGPKVSPHTPASWGTLAHGPRKSRARTPYWLAMGAAALLAAMIVGGRRWSERSMTTNTGVNSASGSSQPLPAALPRTANGASASAATLPVRPTPSANPTASSMAPRSNAETRAPAPPAGKPFPAPRAAPLPIVTSRGNAEQRPIAAPRALPSSATGAPSDMELRPAR